MKKGDTIMIGKVDSESEQKRREYPSPAECFAGYNGDYVPEEWDTGKPVGDEVYISEKNQS